MRPFSDRSQPNILNKIWISSFPEDWKTNGSLENPIELISVNGNSGLAGILPHRHQPKLELTRNGSFETATLTADAVVYYSTSLLTSRTVYYLLWAAEQFSKDSLCVTCVPKYVTNVDL